MKILLSGATGFIGKSLLDALLHEGHELILLSRNPAKITPRPKLSVLQWDGKSTEPWAASAQGVEAIINLAGEGIAEKRWTSERKKALSESRVLSTKAIINFIRSAPKRPSLLINASAVGYYGNVPQGTVTESAPKGEGFLADTCDLWEKEAKSAETLGVRTVLLRTGIVLEKGGGALQKMIFPFSIYAGGPLGSGKQWFPWIHRDDEVGAILFALHHPKLSGPVNLTAPTPVMMKDFCTALGNAMHRPSWAPVPGFALKLLLGEMSEMLLGGQRAVPEKLTASGYKFKFPTVDSALNDILKK